MSWIYANFWDRGQRGKTRPKEIGVTFHIDTRYVVLEFEDHELWFNRESFGFWMNKIVNKGGQ